MIKVPRYENYFSVTEDGKVFSHRTNKYLKLQISKSGYLFFNTRINGSAVSFRVHRMVAAAFIENPGNKPFVNHKDGNKMNNNKSNLEWCTSSENLKHAYETGLMSQKKTTNHKNSKITETQLQEIIENRDKLTLRQLGKKYNVHHTTILSHLRQKLV